jgi:hypothetical protein
MTRRRRPETTMIATTADLRDATPVALPAVDFMPAHPAVGGGSGKVMRALRWLQGAAAAILRGAMVLIVAANVVGCASTAQVVHPAPRAQAVAKCMAAEDAGQPAPACEALASDVAALRVLSAMAGR